MIHWLGCLFEACVLQVRVFDSPHTKPFLPITLYLLLPVLDKVVFKDSEEGGCWASGEVHERWCPIRTGGTQGGGLTWRMAWRTSEQSYLVGPTLPGNALHRNSKFWSINLVPRSASCVCESWTQHWCRVWSAACWCFPPGSQGLSIVTMVVSFEAAPFS